MSYTDLAAIRARNAEFRKEQEELEAKRIAEELAAKRLEEEEKAEEKPAKKPSKRKYLVVDEEAPKDEQGE